MHAREHVFFLQMQIKLSQENLNTFNFSALLIQG